MSVPACGPARVSELVRVLWRELSRPADELDLAAIAEAHDAATAAQAAATDAAGVLFGHESHARKPPHAGPFRPRTWHEVPLLVAVAAFADKAGAADWRQRIAEAVADFAGLAEGLDDELERATKRRKRPRALRAVELIYEGATDEAAAAELGLTPRALRGSLAWKRLRAALAAVELASRPERPRPRTSGRGSNPGKVARRGASKA
jgi:hypothetical protein